MKRKKTVEDRIVTLYSFYYILIASFNMGLDTAQRGLYLFPRQFTLENYQYFFSKRAWVEAFDITILRTVVGTIVAFCSQAWSLTDWLKKI
ncbi:hypothetical protein [Paenibacillus monticola]|uniref:hypothetical protein n=1 Tax=Paenibacillus monticola TaxID=2666075 RepID=UPI001E469618|nr:hypothetical protein [Paenibacillus monticola]